LIDQRRQEAVRAARVLGAEPPINLGYIDFELDHLPAGELRERFIRLIREHRPDVVFAEDVLTLHEVHPDHRAVAMAASDAVHFAHLPLLHPEHQQEGILPHFVVEKYFYSDNPAHANKIVDITTTFEKKIAALGEHKSQVKFLVEEIYQQARIAGFDLAAVLGEAAHDHLAAITWAMQTQASEVGERAGYTYGEAFRYTRFHPFVEGFLSQGSPD